MRSHHALPLVLATALAGCPGAPKPALRWPLPAGLCDGTAPDERAIAGNGDGTLWLACGTVVHHVDASGALLASTAAVIADAHVRHLAVSASGQVWLALGAEPRSWGSSRAASLMRWDGAAWTQVLGSSEGLGVVQFDIAGDRAAVIVQPGSSASDYTLYPRTVRVWEGGRWSELPPLPDANPPDGLALGADGALWVHSQHGSSWRVVRWDGVAWSRVEDGRFDSTLESLASVGGAAWVLERTNEGRQLRTLAGAPSARIPTPEGLAETGRFRIAGTDPTDLWYFAEWGAAAGCRPTSTSESECWDSSITKGWSHWDGARWTLYSEPPETVDYAAQFASLGQGRAAFLNSAGEVYRAP